MSATSILIGTGETGQKLREARVARRELLDLMETINVALRSPQSYMEFSRTERAALELVGMVANDKLRSIPCEADIVREHEERPA